MVHINTLTQVDCSAQVPGLLDGLGLCYSGTGHRLPARAHCCRRCWSSGLIHGQFACSICLSLHGLHDQFTLPLSFRKHMACAQAKARKDKSKTLKNLKSPRGLWMFMILT